MLTSTRIFLDSGNPIETKEILEKLGYLNGQTTNPSLVSKNPNILEKIEKGEKLAKDELLEEYKKIVQDISKQIPEGSVSIEVYADDRTTPEEMIEQAKEMNKWIPNAHIKLPTIHKGLEAAEKLLSENIKLNFTLLFTQEQIAAIYQLTKGIKKGDVFISPFAGRFYEIGEDGIDFIVNAQRMVNENDMELLVLGSSLRNYEMLLYSIYAKIDILTIPYKILTQWIENNQEIPGLSLDEEQFKNQNEYFKTINNKTVKDIEYKEMDLTKDWRTYDLHHELTIEGLKKFSEDWNALIK